MIFVQLTDVMHIVTDRITA